MRVLTVIDSLAPGGAERSLLEIAPHLLERGIDLHVATLVERPGYGPVMSELGIPVRTVAGGGRVARVRALASLIRSTHPDLVHTTLFEADIAGRIAAKVARVPCVTSWVSTDLGPRPRAIRGWAADRLDRITARSALAFHAVSDVVARSMAQRLGIARDRIHVIPRGRDAKVLGTRSDERTRRVRDLLTIRPDDRLIVAVARHDPAKGLDVLLSAWPEVLRAAPATTLVVAGSEAGQTEELRATSRALGDRVLLLGHRPDVADLIAAADLMVVPSRREGMSGAVIEAMAIGTPLVASDIPANREATGGHAAFAAAGDPSALADAIARTLDDPGTASRADAARARFTETFTIERVADATVEFYRRNGRGSWTALASTRSS